MSAAISWQEVCAIALPVVMVCRRESDLWSLPASFYDRTLIYAGAQTSEGQLKLEDPFGSESITVTLRALEGLNAALPAADHVEIRKAALNSLSTIRAADGAYGRRLPAGFRLQPEIIKSPRHTSAALLMLLQFGDEQGLPLNPASLSSTAHWLIGNHGTNKGGGWPFFVGEGERKFAPMSTALTIQALSAVCDRLPALAELALPVVASGFDTLVRERHANNAQDVWAFEHDTPHTQTSDDALVIWSLLVSSRSSLLGRVSPTARGVVAGMATALLRSMAATRWAASSFGLISSLPALIHALHMATALDDAEISEEIGQVLRDLGGELLFRLRPQGIVRHRDFAEDLALYDWATLLVLTGKLTHPAESERSWATHMLSVATESKWRAVGRMLSVYPFSKPRPRITNELIKEAVRLRKLGFAGNLRRQHLSGPIPAASRSAILYALSRGQPAQIRNTWLEERIEKAPFLFRHFLLGLLKYGIQLVLTFAAAVGGYFFGLLG